MNVKPILFNTDMVRVLLDSRKTVTRRVVKPQFGTDADGGTHSFDAAEKNRFRWSDHPNVWTAIPYPYHPGDILYVRETWARSMAGTYLYKATDTPLIHNGWHPSIHMPREAARIFLRVTDVRVERLREITIEEMRTEGVIWRGRPGGCSCTWKTETCMREPCQNRDAYEYECWVLPFIKVWDSTIKKADRALYGWDANPWVWVVEFERISKEEAAP